MRCSYHPSNEAQGTCVTCGRLICNKCINQYEGRILCSYCARVLNLTAQMKENRKRNMYRVLGVVGIGFLFLIIGFTMDYESRAGAILKLFLMFVPLFIALALGITFNVRARRIHRQLQLRIDELRSQQNAIR
jgi:hypothetical protein